MEAEDPRGAGDIPGPQDPSLVIIVITIKKERKVSSIYIQVGRKLKSLMLKSRRRYCSTYKLK